MIKAIFLSLADILGSLFFWLFVDWWAPLFANEAGWLPNWLKWAQTFDADLDQGFRSGNTSFKSRYLNRMFWLYRNNAYGWSYYVLGIDFIPEEWTVHTYTGDEHAKDFTFYATDNRGHFSLHCVRFGIKWKLGWKYWNVRNTKTKGVTPPWGPEWRIPFVFSFGLNN